MVVVVTYLLRTPNTPTNTREAVGAADGGNHPGDATGYRAVSVGSRCPVRSQPAELYQANQLSILIQRIQKVLFLLPSSFQTMLPTAARVRIPF